MTDATSSGASAPVGAPSQGADVRGTTSSPATPTAQKSQSTAERIRSYLDEGDGADAQPAGQSAATDAPSDATDDDAAKNGEPSPPEEGNPDDDDDVADGKERKRVSKELFDRRMREQAQVTRGLKQQLAQKDLELKQAAAGREILAAQLQRLREAREQAPDYDPRDDTIAFQDARSKLREEAERIASEHEEAVRQSEAKLVREAERASDEAELRADIHDALKAADGLVSFEELRNAMHKVSERTGRIPPAQRVAEHLVQQRLAAAEKRRARDAPKPPVVSKTAGGAGTGAVTGFSRDATGIQRWVDTYAKD